ncbi:hypothetical protein BVI434_1040039 [Burkholderia vietnamiensis]|nr:hypothetical protein BVI434_1040039 [Burkholderia vietnamiensis]
MASVVPDEVFRAHPRKTSAHRPVRDAGSGAPGAAHCPKRGVLTLRNEQFLPLFPARRARARARASPNFSFQAVMLLSRQFHSLSHYRHEEPLTFAVP